tara:strand:- start:1015 stop:1233 length:219 start_codon:yes stop_codon:yes gene_type:complete
MPIFIINKNTQPSGDNEVHNATTSCSHMPNSENQIALGSHPSCHEAVAAAKRKWPNNKIDGCYYCCEPCHTS